MKKYLFCCLLFSFNANAQSYSVMADVESIQWLKEAGAPLLKTAGITDNINYRLIRSDDINAFVTPDKSINFFSGLIDKADTQDEVIAVIAHEIGHIKAQHHFKTSQRAEKFTLPTIVSGIAGVAAAAVGAPQAGMALIIGGQAATATQALQHSRIQEREADQIAYSLLTKNGKSLKGLIDFFGIIKQNSLLYSRVPPAYLLSHPLTAERIDAARNYQENLKKGNKVTNKKIDDSTFILMKARLFALTHKPMETLRKFIPLDKSSKAIYARSIAYALQGKGKKSAAMLNELIKRKPNNPYFYDMLGQVYVDIGMLNEGVNAFEKSLKIKPELYLTRLQLAEAYLALTKLNKAFDAYSIVRQKLPKWPSVWHGLGIVYGKEGYKGESHLALAEEALLKHDIKSAEFHIKAATEYKQEMSEPAKKWLNEVKVAMEDK